MKKGFSPIIVLIVIFLVIPAVIVIKKIYSQSLENKTFKIAQLTEQIKILREDLYKPAPTPSPPPPSVERIGLIDKSNISSKNTYTLNCWHGYSAQNSPLSKTLVNILDPQERIHDICINSELQKAVVFTSGNNMALRVYDLKSKDLKTVLDKIFGGGGTCELNIYLWSRENDLYYKIVTCDAPPTKPFIEHLGKIQLGTL